ncbi:MAG: lysine transporter LysE [Flavobacteriaceae bacterium]
MAFLFSFLLGYFISVMAVILPGLINMTVAKIGLQETKREALQFTFGASTVVFIQTYIAVLFARFINIHTEIIALLQEIGVLIFSGLSIYFFWIAKKPKNLPKEVSLKKKMHRYFFGMLLSGLNFLPIPFYVFASISLATSGYFKFEVASIFGFVLGVTAGSFSVFYAYLVAFKKVEQKTRFLMQNINKIIGSIAALMAVLTVVKLCCR